MKTLGERLKEARLSKGFTLEELAKKVRTSKQTISRYEKGEIKNIPYEKIETIAIVLGIDPYSLFTWEQATNSLENSINQNNSIVMLNDVKLYNAPLFESVSAGFGVTAVNEIVGYIPVIICSDDEAADTICIKVKGDSMSPKIEDGDIIQVRKQTSVDSGDIAVVLLDGSEGLVKKVEYDTEWIKLISLNMNYPPIVLKGKDVLRCAVLGKVKRVIRDV